MSIIDKNGFQAWFDGAFPRHLDPYSPGFIILVLGVERTRIYRALNCAEIDGLKIRGIWRIPRPALEAWLMEEGRWKVLSRNGLMSGSKADL